MRAVAWAGLLITVCSLFRKLPKIRREDVEEVPLPLELFKTDDAEMPLFLCKGAEDLPLPFVAEVKLEVAQVLLPFIADVQFDVKEVLLSLELFKMNDAEMPLILCEGVEDLRLPFVTEVKSTNLLPELSLRWRTLQPGLCAWPGLGRRRAASLLYKLLLPTIEDESKSSESKSSCLPGSCCGA